MNPVRMAWLCALLMIVGAERGRAEPAKAENPGGIVKKPIPEKLVVLTFDDGCASHATFVAPLLKKHGFGGTFYVSDAYLFRERKDWYMTWPQIRTMAENGFEIGNHTRGHGSLVHTDVGGCQAYVWTLEDEMIANRIPKSTTFCWPFYLANPRFYPLLYDWGYSFARGGHGRVYRPEADNPFDVPSFAVGGKGMSMNGFVKAVQQATAGRVAVLCFHGVPDGEHAPVGTDPDLFEDMMEYLKENNYKVVAMRDLTEYVDVAKAAKLPPTQEKLINPGPALMVKDDKPYVQGKRSSKSYFFPEEANAPSPGKELYRARLSDSLHGSINGSTITLFVPVNTDVKSLAPTFELVRFATSSPPPGTVRDFSKPQTYTITAQDKSTKDYTFRVVRTEDPAHFSWASKSGANFDDATRWKTNQGVAATPTAGGGSDTLLNFHAPGTYEVTRDVAGEFVLNQLNFSSSSVKLTSKGALVFARSKTNGALPYVNSQNRTSVTIDAPVRLDADLTIDGIESDDTRVSLPGLVTGTGALIKNGPHSLHLSNPNNTWSGGTIVNEGTVFVQKKSLGTGPVMLNKGGAIGVGGEPVSNALTINGGRIFSGGTGRWSGPVVLKESTNISAYESLEFNNKENGISGPGGLTLTGHRVDHATRSGTIKLFGRNTYTGVTRVDMGLLEVMNSFYNNEPARWTPANILVNGAAGELRLHVGSPDGLTIEQAGMMLKNLSTGIKQNGLMAGSTFSLDTTGARGVQDLALNIADSQGPGGGSINMKKCGAGTLKLSGANTWTGATIVEGGALSIESFNSLRHGLASSSLGAPKTPTDAEILLSGGCTLIYSGRGETTDRILNLSGGRDTITLEHAGKGLLKLTSPLVISGYNEDKTLVLTGSGEGVGEIAGSIDNPHDRKKKAATSVIKTGAGTWKFSGTNSYTGATTLRQGTLEIANIRALGDKTEVNISSGAMLELNFIGDMRIGKLTIDGKSLTEGSHDAKNLPRFIKGQGKLTIRN